mmetsp:Transcript_22375/g.47777  ORF Transcript_22375/g.47777 Transcript_22375/m.47777 type:complete len:280 (-) Transcript_22375:27-866(-)
MELERRHASREKDGGNERTAVRVLVLGDAAVGKTSLVEQICSGGIGNRRDDDDTAVAQGDWTCGCTVSLARETLEVGFRTVEVEVELWEVGGTKMYSSARPVFYDDIDGLILVYDVSNMKSYHNLVVWLFELCTSVWPPSHRYWDTGGGSGGVPDLDLETGDGSALQQAILGGRCPVIFVAHKCDLLHPGAANVRGALPRPLPPDRPPLLDRLLGGEGVPGSCRSAADARLMERLCDLVLQGRHTEAASRGDALSFDFALWRDFVRRTLEAMKQSQRET